MSRELQQTTRFSRRRREPVTTRLRRRVLRVAARMRPAIPPRLLRSVIAMSALVTDAPIVAVPAYTRVLVIAPHPDDETIGCGGTIARLAAAGAVVDVVVCTDGDATIGAATSRAETARRRRAETVEACMLLGACPPRFLGLPDGDLPAHVDELAAALDEAIEATRPQAVLAPWALERHPDHRAVITALARAAAHPEVEVWGYEVHSPLQATHVVPLDERGLARKRAALAVHATAGQAFSLQTTLALSRWRSLATHAGEGYAEAFHVTAWDALDHLAGLARAAYATRDEIAQHDQDARHSA